VKAQAGFFRSSEAGRIGQSSTSNGRSNASLRALNKGVKARCWTPRTLVKRSQSQGKENPNHKEGNSKKKEAKSKSSSSANRDFSMA
jgi:hypothetical protein